MSESSDLLALRRKLLLARSTLYRLRIRAGLNDLRDPLGWRRATPPAIVFALVYFAPVAALLVPLARLLTGFRGTRKPR